MLRSLVDLMATKVKLTDRGIVLVSVNPDLVTDFGHFLNYERRLHEACSEQGWEHYCLASRECELGEAFIQRVFLNDSGYYSLYRKQAFGIERQIAREFRAVVLEWLSSKKESLSGKRVVVFFYMGSSKLCVALNELGWPQDVEFVCNGFWDFLLAEGAMFGSQEQLVALKCQSAIVFLAMSQKHAQRILDETGFVFEHIPNPPPLCSDGKALDILRLSYAQKLEYSDGSVRIFFPGLASLGKNFDVVRRLLDGEYVGFFGADVLVRDASKGVNALNAPRGCARFEVLSGDVSEEMLLDIYGRQDIVVIPYGADVFSVRTSGAFVDALICCCIPVVVRGTWMAHMCEVLGIGIVVERCDEACLAAGVHSGVSHSLGRLSI
jgi:hypothetical protein